MLKNYEVVQIDSNARPASITVTKNGVSFSSSVIKGLKNPEYVKLYSDKKNNKIAIQAVDKKDDETISFFNPKKKTFGVKWNNEQIKELITSITTWELGDGIGYKILGKYLASDNAYEFDLTKGEQIKVRANTKK